MKKIKIQIISLVVLLLSAVSALAADEAQMICASPESFIEDIYNCGQNKVATFYAQKCADELMKKSAENGKSLSLLLAELEKAGKENQEAAFADAKNRLELSAAVLRTQIDELKKNTDRIETYTEAMIDFPDSKEDESSAECFNTAYHSLQKIVDRLDKEIIQSKAALEQTQTIIASKQINTKMGTLSQAKVIKGARSPASVGLAAKARRNNSTISGKINSKKTR